MIEYYGTMYLSVFKVIKMINIIAHRGANQVAPQNTIPAFLAALDMNVNGFENDVHLTSDGEVVVCHNDTIDAIGFNMGELSEQYLIGDKVDVVGNLEINSFNGQEKVQINLKDIMKSV